MGSPMGGEIEPSGGREESAGCPAEDIEFRGLIPKDLGGGVAAEAGKRRRT